MLIPVLVIAGIIGLAMLSNVTRAVGALPMAKYIAAYQYARTKNIPLSPKYRANMANQMEEELGPLMQPIAEAIRTNRALPPDIEAKANSFINQYPDHMAQIRREFRLP